MFSKYFEDYQIGEMWVSRARTITETDVVMFSAFSGDWYSLHTDKEYAAKTQFKQRIAHGMLILSVSTGLLHFEPGAVVAFYGMENVRFKKPTFIGDTIHIEVKIIDSKDKDLNTGIITAYVEIKKQTGETVVVDEMKLLVNKKTAVN